MEAPDAAAVPAAAGSTLFREDFRDPTVPRWEPLEGTWEVRGGDDAPDEYVSTGSGVSLSVAGGTSWSNYQVSARIKVRGNGYGAAGLVGRVQRSHHYVELVVSHREGSEAQWALRRRVDHRFQVLASGPFDVQAGGSHDLRLVMDGRRVEAWASNGRDALRRLGEGLLPSDAWTHGKFGVVSYGLDASFDDVEVTAGFTLQAQLGPWGPVAELRDDTNTFPTGKPAGGWYVTPIHATVRARDGKVLLTGFGRKAESSCLSQVTSRETGTTFLLDPNTLDGVVDGSAFTVTPIDEQNLDRTREVLYCAGHNTLADGRIFFSAGTSYSDRLPDTNPERGLTYSRIYDPAAGTWGSFTRIAASMTGGQALTRGEKWYPTNLLMPDGRVLIFGGFHWSAGGPGSKANLSFEMFDPKVLAASPTANPYTVLTQHEEGAAETPPTRGYTNLFLLPAPVPAGNAGGFARSVAVAGGFGRIYLFNHEPGPTGGQRIFARTNALVPNPSANEKGEGASGVLLSDGRLMLVNGGHDGQGAQTAYFHDPYVDVWTTLKLGISRLYGNAVQLPDGSVLVINGYVSELGNINDVANPVGDVRQPQIIDPYASPPTVSTLPAWPEPTARGYHSLAVLLKDGRVLLGGGKDMHHDTGCEKNELRLFSPPYLSAGPRPTVSSPVDGATMTVGGPDVTITHTGTLRAVRGVALVAPGSNTHAFDAGQRYVPLKVVSAGAGTVTVSPPSNPNIAQPGDYMLFVVSDAGVPSTGVHIRLLPPAPCVYAVDGNGPSYIEAEASSRRDGPFTTVLDASRSGGAFVRVSPGSGDHGTVPNEGKVMWFDLAVTNGGGFHLWLLANGPENTSDSFWVSMDGGPDRRVDLPAASWGWRRVGSTPLPIPSGPHTLKIKVREDGALIDKIALTRDATLTPTGSGPTALRCSGAPSWVGQDVGAVAAAGSFTESAGTFTVRGSGADIQGNADEFHFVHDSLTGDGSLTARVVSVQNTNPWAKAGVMMREDTTAGARNVFALAPGSIANKYGHQRRVNVGGGTSPGAAGTGDRPVWLRVTRFGNDFSTHYSMDGTTWVQMGSVANIPMPATIRVGLAVTSHADGTVAAGVFDGVALTASPSMRPVATTRLTATAGTRQCTLGWAAVPGATSYAVKRSTTSGGPYAPVTAGVVTTSFVDASLTSGTPYHYVVTASNGAGEGPPSVQASCTPL